MNVRIGVDLMGGDHSPFTIWEALIHVLELGPNCAGVQFVVFVSKEVQEQILAQNLQIENFPDIVVSENEVCMTDTPLMASRKKTSSMAIGLDFLQNGNIDAFVSTGNTAALVTLSRARIPLFPNVSRPALIVQIPAMHGSVVLLDVGANVSVKPEEMLGFARMGVAYRECLKQTHDKTKVGLLNIGSEERKGTEAHRQTYHLLREAFQDDFVGNIESGDVFTGNLDVVVTDGFTGNIFLKTTEGLFYFLRSLLGNQLEADLRNQLNYTIYPGSLVCGLSKLVIKCHGKANEHSLYDGIIGAIDLAKSDVCHRILKELTKDFL